MPTYEYACKACGHAFEEIQKMSDPPIELCPKCGASAAQRLISQGNFILKGGGWYTTGGYGTTGTKPSGDDGGGSGGGGGKKADTPAKSESTTSTTPSTTPAAPSTPTGGDKPSSKAA